MEYKELLEQLININFSSRTTLYSRLKPEFKKIIEEKSKEYPSTAKTIIESLQKTMYSRMTICEVTDLMLFLKIYKRAEKEWWLGNDLFSTENSVS